MEVQAALLRFLDTHGEYCRLGDTQARRVSVQVVCATNQPLDDPSYRSGHFRDDLWYRLASAVIWVPPLRERREDILAYLHHRTLPGSPHPLRPVCPRPPSTASSPMSGRGTFATWKTSSIARPA